MKRAAVILGLMFVALLTVLPAAAQPLSDNQAAPVIPGRYIVVLQDKGAQPAIVADDMARQHGLSLVHVYRHSLKGFTMLAPDRVLAAIERDPRVAFVEPDRAYTVADQVIPTGIDRIETDKNPNANGVVVDLDVAIIDTGINSHDDLNLVGGINLAGGSPNKYGDGYGHGTHVAGTVGAKDNSIGVVGVAPGVRLWAVRVCNNGGICLTGDMIAGIDWVTGRKLEAHDGDTDPGVDFAAANMSLGTSNNATPCSEVSGDALRNAVCGLVGSGVPLALAAGNESTTKVAYEAAIAVSAVADFDGKGGGAASPTCRTDQDDTLADFSNFGSTIDIAAPGVCILSTLSGGGYGFGSGTSMATPHVAGAVALYLHVNGLPPAIDRAGADTIRQAIVDAAIPQSHLCGFFDDSGDDSAEPLLFVNAIAFEGDGTCDTATAEPTHDVAVTTISASPDAATQGDTVTVAVDVANQGDFSETFDVTVTESPDGDNLGTQSISLAAGATDTLTFEWITDTATAEGDHTIIATASIVTDETDTADNQKSTTVTVSSPSAGVTVNGIDPNTMQAGTTVDVTITGSGFTAGAEVTFENGTGPAPTASNIVVVDGNTITTTVTAKGGGPPRDRVWDVLVTRPDNSAGILVDGFTVTP